MNIAWKHTARFSIDAFTQIASWAIKNVKKRKGNLNTLMERKSSESSSTVNLIFPFDSKNIF